MWSPKLVVVAWSWTVMVMGVSGQTTNATCTSNSTTSWLFNSNGESPCLVWSRIQSLCLGPQSYINVPPLLDASWGYNSPNGGTQCQCNFISYALMSGCSWCQQGDTNNWASEDDWKTACGTYTADGLGFAETVEPIPAYAWRQWQGSRWIAAQASISASSFSTLTPTGTTTLSRSLLPITKSSPSSSPVSPSISTPPRPSISNNGTSSDSSNSSAKTGVAKWGPIVGGIAGGVFGLVLLFLLFRWFRSRQTRPNDPNLVVSYKPPPTSSHQRKSRSQSFLDMFGAGRMSMSQERANRRETELMADPYSFAAPRPAPKAPSQESLRYTTTQDRMRNRPPSEESEMSMVQGRQEVLRSNVQQQQESGGLIVDHYDADEDDSVHQHQFVDSPEPQSGVGGGYGQKATYTPTPHSLSQDFTQPRPYTADDSQILPSLYDPPTGAERYTVQSDMTGQTLTEGGFSPESRYPVTERASSIGEALGSGRRRDRHGEQYWSRQELPPLPRGVSEESIR